jgi:hypothetical protein
MVILNLNDVFPFYFTARGTLNHFTGSLSLNPITFLRFLAALTFNSFNIVLVLLDTDSCLPLDGVLYNIRSSKQANPLL